MSGLAERARAVLDDNWLGDATRPGPHLYPHQWSWDAAFAAIGYATFAPERGWQELRSLFRGQWSSGLLPHIVFHPGTEAYFPGPEVWRTDLSPAAPRDVQTSGIVQPPLHASAALRLFRVDPDREQLADLFPRLVAWHDYLDRERDPEDDGCVAIRHPWESGQDDSPAWDPALEAVPAEAGPPPYRRVDLTMVAAHQRPTDLDYGHYMALVERFKRHRYDELEIRRRSPFLAEEVVFNALLVRAGEDLAALAQALGHDDSRFRAQAARTRDAMNERLWSERLGRYVSRDLRTGRLLPASVSATFVPLFAGVPDPARAGALLDLLSSRRFWPTASGGFAVPSSDRLSPAFSPRRYWRGPVWVNLNWLIHEGLIRYGFGDQAEALRAMTIELVSRSGFREYFDPRDGEGLGAASFTWTAALTLDLLRLRQTT